MMIIQRTKKQLVICFLVSFSLTTVTSSILTGCMRVCEQQFEGWCEGNTSVECRYDDDCSFMCDLEEIRKPCGDKHCVEYNTTKSRSFCALEENPNPACPEMYFNKSCDGNRIITCEEGYVKSERVCEDGKFCNDQIWDCTLLPGKDPVCVELSEKDPYSQVTCADNYAVVCSGGYRVDQEYCGEESLCLVFSRVSAQCVFSPTLDLRCEQLHDDYKKTGCVDNVLITCVNNYLISEIECGDKVCEASRCK